MSQRPSFCGCIGLKNAHVGESEPCDRGKKWTPRHIFYCLNCWTHIFDNQGVKYLPAVDSRTRDSILEKIIEFTQKTFYIRDGHRPWNDKRKIEKLLEYEWQVAFKVLNKLMAKAEADMNARPDSLKPGTAELEKHFQKDYLKFQTQYESKVKEGPISEYMRTEDPTYEKALKAHLNSLWKNGPRPVRLRRGGSHGVSSSKESERSSTRGDSKASAGPSSGRERTNSSALPSSHRGHERTNSSASASSHSVRSQRTNGSASPSAHSVRSQRTNSSASPSTHSGRERTNSSASAGRYSVRSHRTDSSASPSTHSVRSHRTGNPASTSTHGTHGTSSSHVSKRR